MEAIELRIGNIVKLDPIGWSLYKNELFKVVSIEYRHNDYKVYLNFADGRKWPVTPNLATSIEFIKPVKLTEDVLVKCGFMKSARQSTKQFREYHLNHGSYRIKAIAHDDGAWLWKIDGFDFEVGREWSLHRLQNVFYDLFDEKMEEKL